MRNEDITCPYKVSGLCYRKGCIHIPEIKCMKKREYDDIMRYNKHRNKFKKRMVKHNER